jgi:UDP-N-acetyl-D-mannosaminuronic acid dehydrogenase
MPSVMNLKREDLDTPEKRANYTVAIVGCGRMGLPHAALFAEAGFNVIGVDSNPQVFASLKRGKASFFEPGLDPIIRKHVKEKRFAPSNETRSAAAASDIIMPVVQTPLDERKRPDYSSLEKACKDIGMGMHGGCLFILASTVGPRITDTLVKETLENASGLKTGKDFALAYSPIRATSGRVLRDIQNYTKVVGAVDKNSFDIASSVLSTIVKADIIEVSSIKVAETMKLLQNVYRDANLALTNEFACFCEKIGVDFLEVQKAVNTDPYCHLLVPGIVSGHIPKDPYLLIEEAENVGLKLRLTQLAREVNDSMVDHAIHLVRDAMQTCGKPLARTKISVLGVSYRPNIKEPRGSLTMDLVKRLKKKSVYVHVFDPFFRYEELEELGYPPARTLIKAMEGADCLLIMVGHDVFKRINLRRFKFLARKPAAVVDMGHVINPAKAEKEGVIYRGFGRGVWTK